ncbi:unnamed protein product, partial [Brassica oleracea]
MKILKRSCSYFGTRSVSIPLVLYTRCSHGFFWPLWRERNLLIFENRSLSSEEDSTKRLALAREWRWENKQKLIKNKPLPDLSRERSLGQTTEPEIVCKSDATRHSKSWTGSGIDTSETRQGYTTVDFANSPLMAAT